MVLEHVGAGWVQFWCIDKCHENGVRISVLGWRLLQGRENPAGICRVRRGQRWITQGQCGNVVGICRVC